MDVFGLQCGRVHTLYVPLDTGVLARGEVKGNKVEGGAVTRGGLIHAAAGCRPHPVPPGVEDACERGEGAWTGLVRLHET